MFSWSQDWKMLFNTDKSEVMHFDFNNKEVDYILGNQRLNAVEEERDLGVIVGNQSTRHTVNSSHRKIM